MIPLDVYEEKLFTKEKTMSSIQVIVDGEQVADVYVPGSMMVPPSKWVDLIKLFSDMERGDSGWLYGELPTDFLVLFHKLEEASDVYK